MEWVHCNKMCGKALVIDRCGFYFTACGHIICDTCHEKAQDSTCPVCAKSTRFVRLEDLPKDVRESYFTDSDASLRQFSQGILLRLDEVIKVADFQATQDKFYNKACNKILAEMHMKLQGNTEKMNKMQMELQAKDKEMQAMQDMMSQMRLEINNIQREPPGHQASVCRSRGAPDGASGAGLNQRMLHQQETGFPLTQATNRNGGNPGHTQATERTRLNRNGGDSGHTQATERTHLNRNGQVASGFPNTQATNRNSGNLALTQATDRTHMNRNVASGFPNTQATNRTATMPQTQNTERTRLNQNTLRQHQGQQNSEAFAVPQAPANRMPDMVYRPINSAALQPVGQTGRNSIGMASGRLVSGTSAGGPPVSSPVSFRNPSLLSRFGNQGLASTTNRISLPNPIANRPSSVNSSNIVSPASSIGRQTMSFLGMSPSSAANASNLRNGLRRF